MEKGITLKGTCLVLGRQTPIRKWYLLRNLEDKLELARRRRGKEHSRQTLLPKSAHWLNSPLCNFNSQHDAKHPPAPCVTQSRRQQTPPLSWPVTPWSPVIETHSKHLYDQGLCGCVLASGVVPSALLACSFTGHNWIHFLFFWNIIMNLFICSPK